MTEEIKEILDFLKDKRGYYKTLQQDKTDKLLNYITNLQKENEKLKELCDKYEEEHSKAFKLWKENMEKIPPFDKFLDYKQRNEKAVEYCKKEIKYIHQYFENADSTDLIKILNILQGGDE